MVIVLLVGIYWDSLAKESFPEVIKDCFFDIILLENHFSLNIISTSYVSSKLGLIFQEFQEFLSWWICTESFGPKVVSTL